MNPLLLFSPSSARGSPGKAVTANPTHSAGESGGVAVMAGIARDAKSTAKHQSARMCSHPQTLCESRASHPPANLARTTLLRGRDAPTPRPRPSWLLPLLGTLVLIGLTVWIVAAQLPPVGSVITFPPDTDPALRNATLATLRITCAAQCGTRTFVNFGLVDVDDLPGVTPGTTYPACICRNPDDTLTRITLRVTR